MTEEESKKLSSLIGSLKGTVIKNVKIDDFDLFFSWCNKLVLDTRKDKTEKALLSKIKAEKMLREKQNLLKKKRSFCRLIIHLKLKLEMLFILILDMDIVVNFQMDIMVSLCLI